MRRLFKLIRHLPNLLQGYNIYVNKEKFALIDEAFGKILANSESFADLGGVWKVNAAYTRYVLKKYAIKRAYLIDTNYTARVMKKIAGYKNLDTIEGDFTSDEVIKKIAGVDVIFLFDVLLHQVNPDWDQVLEKYARITKSFIIYNQQLIDVKKSMRLTNLPLEKYTQLVPARRDTFYETIYAKDQQIHPQYKKPWKDIHNIWQWGITDDDLREKMTALGYEQVYYKNYGRFADLKTFEDHAFVFVRHR
jgi:hypothetical protein